MEGQNMPEKITFTHKRLGALAPPDDGRQYVYDSKTPGLALCVTSAGSKTFYLYRWINGKPERVRLGKFGEVSIDDARDAAREIVGEIAKGRDPAVERRSRRQERTLDDVWLDWLEIHAKPRKKTWRDDERQYHKYLAPLHDKRVSTLTAARIAKWHVGVGEESGHTQANRAKALLSAILGYAVKLGLLAGNPCRSVPGFPERSRERFLLPAEMKRFFDALAAAGEPWHDFFQLALFTGARRGNVASMEWAEIDFERTTWTIPGSKSKNGRPTIIALSPPAILILKTRLDTATGSPYVFPSGSATGHVVDPRKAWERLRKDSGLADLRMHDLRRSLGSWQATAGASLAVIGGSLGHADLKSTQVYARLQLDPIQASVEAAAQAMRKAAGLLIDETEGTDNGQE
jgi:integrase